MLFLVIIDIHAAAQWLGSSNECHYLVSFHALASYMEMMGLVLSNHACMYSS